MGHLVGHRALPWFVELGHRSVRHALREKAGNTFRGHNEGVLTSVGGYGRIVTINHIAIPPPRASLSRVPLNDRMLLVPRLAIKVNRGTIVNNAAIDGPAPRPLGVKPNIKLVGGQVAASCHIAIFSVTGAVNPVTAGGGAVVLQRAKTGQEFASSKVIAVDVFSYFVRVGWVTIVPSHFDYRVSIGSTLLGIEFFEFKHQLVHHPEVILSLAGSFRRFVTPLHPATAIGDTAFLFKGTKRWQDEDLGINLCGVSAGAFPEVAGLSMPQVNDHQPVQFPQGAPFQYGVGASHRRILPPAKHSLNFASVHGFKHGNPGIVFA